MSNKLTKEMIDLLIEQVLNEDLEYKIKESGEDEFRSFRDLESFVAFVDSSEFDLDKQYTVKTPQTDDEEATGSGTTIKDKFLGLATKEPDMETEKTGYLGELPFENYRDDIVKLPDLYINAFANSGFLVGDFENRIKSLSNYLENQPDVDHLSEQFSKIIVMELLEKIIIHITQGRTQKLKEGGFLFESFLALLLSGTAPVDSKSYIDLIDNKLNNISIKFSATKSSFYQAFSTVEKYFQTNRQPMIHIMAVKTKVSAKENSIIDIHRSEFTYDDYLKVLEALKKSKKSYAETDKAHVITKPKSRYTVENDWETATATIKFGKGKYETGNQPRITFKQYGEKITTLSLMPPKAMRQFSKEKMDSYDENIDLLFKELTCST